MNGLECLVRLGISEQHVVDPQQWVSVSADVAFARLLETPIANIVANPIESIDGQSGILKGKVVMEVLSYRDATKALPPPKTLETVGDEQTQYQSYSNNRTLKLLLSSGRSERTFVAMEYEGCPCLDDIRLDSKIQISNCYYHHGIFLLTPETVKVLGCPSKPFQDVQAAAAAEQSTNSNAIHDAILLDD